MKFGVVVFPGSNCDADCYNAIADIPGAQVRYVWHKDRDISDLDCVVLPGGFSYGDYLRTGAIAALSPVMESVADFAKRGGLVLGICNGFQILLEAGLLPGAMRRNSTLTFICKDVYVKVERADTPFTSLYRQGQVIKMPIAHSDGNYYADQKTLDALETTGRVVFRYCDTEGLATAEHCPNGAMNNIAGIINESGNVLGLMPHPERCSEGVLGSGEDGRMLLMSCIHHLNRGR